MKITSVAAALAAAMSLATPLAEAAGIDSIYTSLGGNAWWVDFSVIHDGTPAVAFTGFTIDFPQATNLSLVQSPAGWDSLVIQPDPAIPDDGFFDSLALDANNALLPGASIGGFRVAFTYEGGAPGALPFLITDANNVPVFAGMTSVVPEPGAAWLLALGLPIAGFRAARAKARSGTARASTTCSFNEVTA